MTNLDWSTFSLSKTPRFYQRFFRLSALRQKNGVALPVAKKGFGLRVAALRAAETGDFDLARIPFLRLLGGVGKAGGVAEGFDFGGGDVDVVGGGEHHGVVSDFVVVEGGFFVGGEPGVEGELGEGAVVSMVVDGPVGEEDVGILGGEKLSEVLVMGFVDDGLAVDLFGVNGRGVEDLAGFLRFGGADGGAIRIRRFAEAFATVEIEESDSVAEGDVAGDGASNAAFGVAGMSAGDYDFERDGRRGKDGCGEGGSKEFTASERHILFEHEKSPPDFWPDRLFELFNFAGALLAVALAGEGFFSTAFFPWFQVERMPLDLFNDIFLLYFAFEASKSTFERLAILEMDFCQLKFTTFQKLIV